MNFYLGVSAKSESFLVLYCSFHVGRSQVNFRTVCHSNAATLCYYVNISSYSSPLLLFLWFRVPFQTIYSLSFINVRSVRSQKLNHYSKQTSCLFLFVCLFVARNNCVRFFNVIFFSFLGRQSRIVFAFPCLVSAPRQFLSNTFSDFRLKRIISVCKLFIHLHHHPPLGCLLQLTKSVKNFATVCQINKKRYFI